MIQTKLILFVDLKTITLDVDEVHQYLALSFTTFNTTQKSSTPTNKYTTTIYLSDSNSDVGGLTSYSKGERRL